MTLDSSKLDPTWWCDVGSAVSAVAGIWTRSVKCQMRCRLMKEIARCWAWAMEKLYSSTLKCRRSTTMAVRAWEVFQEMDDGEPQSMSQVLWLISLGLTSEELITNSNGEPDECEKDEEMQIILTTVDKWGKADSYGIARIAKSFKTIIERRYGWKQWRHGARK